MKKHLLILLFSAAMVLTSCTKKNEDRTLILPENKVWAHRVNTIEEIQAKENSFEGMELDLFYSTYQNKLFVCHYDEDTIKNITLEKWLAAFKTPEKHCFWLDIKGLTLENCDTIVYNVKNNLKQYNLENKSFIENSSHKVLTRVKELGMHTSLWVENFLWSDIDTASWVNKVRQGCDICSPDALSCEWHMFGALTTFFPEKNIFLWHTPADETPENIEITREMCRNKSVKIVLVDYDEPVDY